MHGMRIDRDRTPIAAIAGSLAFAASLLGGETVQADDYYKGKNLVLLIDSGVGGEKDVLTRLIGRHITAHLPGHPTAVPQNMPGAGGLKMVNYLYGIAPKDGFSIGQVASNIPMLQAVGAPGISFDTGKFQWIGSSAAAIGTIAMWHGSGIKSLADAKTREVTAGSIGKGAMTYILPTLINNYLGTKFRVVTGYQGGSEINLAMERGEIEGRQNSWSAWKTTKADWLKDGKITIIAQAGPKAPDLPDVPSLEQLAATPDERLLVELIDSGYTLGRPFAAPPGTPVEQVRLLRAAFDATMKDPAFLKEAAALNVDVDPMAGGDLEALVKRVLATPPHIIARARTILAE
jgi:tripartite-type tricarboxylate transporter receptor subunit TctC